MHRVRLLYDTHGWAYHKRCLALQKYAPDDFDVNVKRMCGSYLPTGEYDLILQLCYGAVKATRQQLRQRKQSTILVAGLNVGTDRQHLLKSILKHADHVVVNSKLCYEQLGTPDNCTWISNGVDRKIYRVIRPIATRKPKVIWCGSKYHSEVKRDTKGYHTILLPLKERLEAEGIEVDYRRVDSHGAERQTDCYHDTDDMVRWYNTGTIYVNASRSEGTPNPALEAAACGCAVVSTPIGNMPELIDEHNGRLVEPTLDSIHAGVRDCLAAPTMAERMRQSIASWDWSARAPAYYDLFRRLLCR